MAAETGPLYVAFDYEIREVIGEDPLRTGEILDSSDVDMDGEEEDDTEGEGLEVRIINCPGKDGLPSEYAMSEAIETAMVAAKVNRPSSVVLTPSQHGWGDEWEENLVQRVPLSQLPTDAKVGDEIEIEVGLDFDPETGAQSDGESVTGEIISIVPSEKWSIPNGEGEGVTIETDDDKGSGHIDMSGYAMIDTNHPLAGITVEYRFLIHEKRPATRIEISRFLKGRM